MVENGDARGIVIKASLYPSVPETVERLRKTAREKDLEEFALIDHRGAAERAGLEMQEDKLLDGNLNEVGSFIANSSWGVQALRRGGKEYVLASNRDYGLSIFEYTGQQ